MEQDSVKICILPSFHHSELISLSTDGVLSGTVATPRRQYSRSSRLPGRGLSWASPGLDLPASPLAGDCWSGRHHAVLSGAWDPAPGQSGLRPHRLGGRRQCLPDGRALYHPRSEPGPRPSPRVPGRIGDFHGGRDSYTFQLYLHTDTSVALVQQSTNRTSPMDSKVGVRALQRKNVSNIHSALI